MEKNDFASMLVYLVMLVLAFFVGQTVIKLGQVEVAPLVGNYVVYIIIAIVASAMLFTIFFEIGHLVGAKIGKYDVVCINIFCLCFTKVEKKWKFSFKGPEGLLSETRFVPAQPDCNPKKFLWGGFISFAITIVISFSLFLIPKMNPIIKYSSLIYIGIGLVMLFYNIVPIPLDILNDGYRIKLLGNKSNVAAYNEFMRIENDIRNGIEPHDIQIYENISHMTVMVNLYRFYELLDKGEQNEAIALIDMMLAHVEEIDGSTITRLYANKLYFTIMTKPIEEAKEYYWKTLSSKERKEISGDKNLVCRRAYLLVSGVINESYSESRIALSNYRNVLKITDKVKKNVEMRLYKEAIEKVKTVLPQADFEDLL